MARAHGGGPFGRGGSRRADRGFWGTFDQVPVFGFRYRYTTSSGKSTQTHHFLVTGIRFPGARFPPMSLAYESSVLFGRNKDFQFENQQFNETWHVKSASPRFAHDVLHPRAMEYLLGPVPPFHQLWFSGDAVFASITGDPDPLRELRAKGFEVDNSGPGVSLAVQRRRMQHLATRWARPPR